MELAIPLIALGGLYVVSKQQRSENELDMTEGFETTLPNTDIPNKNYPSEYPIVDSELTQTESLTVNNHYNGSTYTDNYFNLYSAYKNAFSRILNFYKNGVIKYYSDSDAQITKGVVTVFSNIYGGHTPDEIVSNERNLTEELNFGNILSVNRRNGAYSMLLKIKEYAKACKE